MHKALGAGENKALRDHEGSQAESKCFQDTRLDQGDFVIFFSAGLGYEPRNERYCMLHIRKARVLPEKGAKDTYVLP